jgi:hypothetical protein
MFRLPYSSNIHTVQYYSQNTLRIQPQNLCITKVSVHTYVTLKIQVTYSQVTSVNKNIDLISMELQSSHIFYVNNMDTRVTRYKIKTHPSRSYKKREDSTYI